MEKCMQKGEEYGERRRFCVKEKGMGKGEGMGNGEGSVARRRINGREKGM